MSSLKEFEPENRASEPVSKDWAVVLVYSLTIFLSAVLLFVVQPMFARLILPLLGGSPYVWNTVLVFYQAALLAGYSYSHFSIKWLGFKKQIIVHLILLALAFSVLPFGVGSASPPKDANPVPWLLVLCLTSVGLPFFAVSATSPILQRWFSISEHKSASEQDDGIAPYLPFSAEPPACQRARCGQGCARSAGRWPPLTFAARAGRLVVERDEGMRRLSREQRNRGFERDDDRGSHGLSPALRVV